MKVKICGMRDVGNIKDIVELKPDYMGFIFYKPSPRSCIGIDPDIIASIPKCIEPVMVSVDMTEDEILDAAGIYGFHTVQLHGNESPEMCRHLRSKGIKVIKAIGIHSKESLETLHKYEGSVDLFLLDTSTQSKGGSGKKFDWNILNDYRADEPFILSGGIGHDDAETLFAIRHPKFEGIDLNSRFEISPGIKNAQLLDSFLSSLRPHLIKFQSHWGGFG